MRIVSGKFKGRRINPPRNITARPTTDFAKEALFNVLNNRVDFEEITVLDLFAGIGSISFEFASRGCESITTVEMNKHHATFIRKACVDLKIDSINLIQGDAFRFIKSGTAKFDLIFVDPPYQLPELPTIPDLIFEKELLKEEGVLILEHSSKIKFDTHPRFKEQRHYGSVNFSFFE